MIKQQYPIHGTPKLNFHKHDESNLKSLTKNLSKQPSIIQTLISNTQLIRMDMVFSVNFNRKGSSKQSPPKKYITHGSVRCLNSLIVSLILELKFF